ncbi:DUF4198 domain-containing protein [Hymenobacter sp. BT730]|uniref:DUF4198 domain-containing protein n=1 Tax=Hymenobacter sp. BT730 TaxID=3063332 RepID=UPI0026E0715F|nr:DUF4198 domain-containing protein [Hymenobacter sp. BT730]
MHPFPRFSKVSMLCAAFLLGQVALGNDFWLRPSQYHVSPGATVYVQRLVGQQFKGERWSGTSQRVAQLLHYAPNDTVDLTQIATQHDTLQTSLALNESGTHLLGFTSNEVSLTQSATEFNNYLKAEGLDQVLLTRQRRKQLEKPARETYRRCAKTLVQVGTASDGPFNAVLGQPLELVPEQNPYALRPGTSITVRVLENGQPARGQLVRVWLKAGLPTQPATVQNMYTSGEGRVLVRLPPTPVEVLVTAVRMRPHPDSKTADWQSAWASLTFGLGKSARR